MSNARASVPHYLAPYPRPATGGRWVRVKGGRLQYRYDIEPADEEVVEMWVEAPIGDDERWIAALRIVPERGVPVVAELRIFPNEPDRYRARTESDEREQPFAGVWSNSPGAVPPGGLRTRETRVPLKSYMAEAYEALGQFAAFLGDDAPAELARLGFSVADVEAPRKPQGRKAMGDLDLARLAARWVALCKAGAGNARQQLADEMGKEPEWVRDRVRAARQRDLLTKVPQGQTGGALTAKAVELLRAMDGSDT